ncbi:MAG TPA: bifunctional diaminohydroxyphosphoribosylaminopyrimidine deaminase/5-amino-6-(5-phosphoribosylamino)uracil reductase RibD [Candidatus Acidoferrales bacterium]|nr:bifunctional diaminohydroxyphosphoribosylaminopyrimidine deaminase/5-amino-6-(5-phosphoribosylamino)uracil reductase RibD [Candidatus Acidoferrales bacterium]
MTPGEVDERYMRMALRLAARAHGRTSPNPMVGAVLVRGGRIIATGYHRRAGQDHAEIVALKKAGAAARGATLYLNLEPCNHFGRTPPCAPSLIAAGIRRVVAGMVDPDPRVSGKGLRRLRRAGIDVTVGVLEDECRKLNEAFVKYATKKIPFVLLKLAASLDGKIATASGSSKWITGEKARRLVQQARNRVDAVLVGVETVVADDPLLTCRVRGGRNPWRVILDGRLRIPLTARVLGHADREKTIVVTATSAPKEKIAALQTRGVQVWRVPRRGETLPWSLLLKRLAQLEVTSVMIEGGGITAAAALAAGAVDKVWFFYAPKIIGGDGRSMIGPLGVKKMAAALRVKNVEIRRLGGDILLSGYC